MVTERSTVAGEFVNPQGSEAREGQTMLEPGKRLQFPDIAMLATYGLRMSACTNVRRSRFFRRGE